MRKRIRVFFINNFKKIQILYIIQIFVYRLFYYITQLNLLDLSLIIFNIS